MCRINHRRISLRNDNWVSVGNGARLRDFLKFGAFNVKLTKMGALGSVHALSQPSRGCFQEGYIRSSKMFHCGRNSYCQNK